MMSGFSTFRIVISLNMWLWGNDLMTDNKQGSDGGLMTKYNYERINQVFTFPASTDRLSAPIIWRSGVEWSFWITTQKYVLQNHSNTRLSSWVFFKFYYCFIFSPFYKTTFFYKAAFKCMKNATIIKPLLILLESSKLLFFSIQDMWRMIMWYVSLCWFINALQSI